MLQCKGTILLYLFFLYLQKITFRHFETSLHKLFTKDLLFRRSRVLFKLFDNLLSKIPLYYLHWNNKSEVYKGIFTNHQKYLSFVFKSKDA